jgi:hypothetical protein
LASTGVYSTLLQNAGFIKEEWESQVIRGAVANAVAVNLIKSYPTPMGSKLHIPRLSAPTASVVTKGSGGDEGGTATFATISDADAEITPTFAYAGYQVPFSSESELLARAGLWAGEMANALQEAIRQKVDTTIVTLYSGLGNVVNAAGDALVWDDFLTAVETLEKGNAPRDQSGLYYGLFHAESYGEIHSIEEVAKTGVFTGLRPGLRSLELPQLGLMVFFDNNVVESTFKKNLIFSTEAFGIAYNTGVNTEEERSVQKLSTFIAMTHEFGAIELTDAYAVTVNSPATV